MIDRQSAMTDGTTTKEMGTITIMATGKTMISRQYDQSVSSHPLFAIPTVEDALRMARDASRIPPMAEAVERASHGTLGHR